MKFNGRQQCRWWVAWVAWVVWVVWVLLNILDKMLELVLVEAWNCWSFVGRRLRACWKIPGWKWWYHSLQKYHKRWSKYDEYLYELYIYTYILYIWINHTYSTDMSAKRAPFSTPTLDRFCKTWGMGMPGMGGPGGFDPAMVPTLDRWMEIHCFIENKSRHGEDYGAMWYDLTLQLFGW